jgi:hypothetical protein
MGVRGYAEAKAMRHWVRGWLATRRAAKASAGASSDKAA